MQQSTPFGVEAGAVWLLLERCTQCDAEHFPPKGYGCERCGAEPQQLSTHRAPSESVVMASSDVNFAPGSDLAVPATIAQLTLSSSPTVFYARLDGGMLPAGTAVVGRVSDEDGVQQLHFVSAEESS